MDCCNFYEVYSIIPNDRYQEIFIYSTTALCTCIGSTIELYDNNLEYKGTIRVHTCKQYNDYVKIVVSNYKEVLIGDKIFIGTDTCQGSVSLSFSYSVSTSPSCSGIDTSVITIEKVGCYSYQIVCVQPLDVQIYLDGAIAYDINGDELIFSNYKGDTINLPEVDGLYTVLARQYNIPYVDLSCYQTLYIFELCDFYKCIDDLRRYLTYCEVDPCCEECDTETKDHAVDASMWLNRYTILETRLVKIMNSINLNGWTTTNVNDMTSVFNDIQDLINCGCFNCKNYEYNKDNR